MPKGTFAAVCAALAALAVAATGCTATTTAGQVGQTDRDGSPARGEARTAGQGRELTAAEHLLVRRAEEMLVKECMADAGFPYWIGPLPTADDLKGSGYVLTDVDWARSHGYGSRLEQKAEEARRGDPNHAYANALTGEERYRYTMTLEGGPESEMLTAELPGGGAVQTPAASCQVEAKEQLYGDFETWFRVEKTATNLTSVYLPGLLRDERFTGALADWSACMDDAGHTYADPPAVRADLFRLTSGLTPREAFATEVALAVAEATCAQETSLVTTARALEAEYREQQLGRYGDDVAVYESRSLAALARAEEITGSTA